MTEATAKKHLSRMLTSFTAGSILHMLADIFHDAAEEARADNDESHAERCRTVEAALIVFGYGVDAAYPR